MVTGRRVRLTGGSYPFFVGLTLGERQSHSGRNLKLFRGYVKDPSDLSELIMQAFRVQTVS